MADESEDCFCAGKRWESYCTSYLCAESGEILETESGEYLEYEDGAPRGRVWENPCCPVS